jgi:hypothetical protein
MTEMSAKSQQIVQEMILLPVQNKLKRKMSLKKKREYEAQTLLKAQGIKHNKACYRCSLDCEVKHQESTGFWAKEEKTDSIAPVYNITNCPKVVFDIIQCELCEKHIGKEDVVKMEKPFKMSLCEDCANNARRLQNGTDNSNT